MKHPIDLSKRRPTVRQWIGQGLLFALFFGPVAMLAGWPAYRQLAPDEAELKLSLRHSGQRIGECRERDAAELASLPENMRATMDCPRERSPVTLQLDLNGERLIDATLEPQGLHGDGRAVFYRRIRIPAGDIRLDVRMKDDARQVEFPYEAVFESRLAPEQALVVDFDAESGKFVFL